MRTIVVYIASLLASIGCYAQEQPQDSAVVRLKNYIRTIENFGNNLPQEKVHLHFDNTGYYQGDHIWFQCYVVSPEWNRPTPQSKTLYVELLNPGGEIIAKRVLPIENGRCRGDFQLTHLPFYSGFYEVRAYTKYMLNFGEEIIFSRVFPVFDKPRQKGDHAEKSIRPKIVHRYQPKRELPKKERKVNLKFYPEGGNLVEGIPSRIAFEATDAYGNPLELSGTVVDAQKSVYAAFSTTHEGRGVFTCTPAEGGSKAAVDFEGRKYSFDLPSALSQGFVLQVDNLSSADSIAIVVRKNPQTPRTLLGLALVCQGKLYGYCIFNLNRETPARVKFGKAGLPAGAAQIALFDAEGRIVADRLIFTRKPKQLTLRVKKDRQVYRPYDPVEMEFSVRDTAGMPVHAPLSVSVRDGQDEVEGRHTMLTELLLMSEIKGYVHRPGYYFEADDLQHREALDVLLMVQGWRRYAWEQLTAPYPPRLEYRPEQGVEVHGKVVTLGRSKPRPGVQVSAYLSKRGEDDATENAVHAASFDTDSAGRFAFVTDISGKWSLILAVTENGKKKDHQIVLDRLFSPAPAKYRLADMQVSTGETADYAEQEQQAAEIPDQVDLDKLLTTYEDSLKVAGIKEKIHRVEEVVIKAKRQSREKDIYANRAKSIAYYDVASEIDRIRDEGGYIGSDIHDLLTDMNPHFIRWYNYGDEYLKYKGRLPLVVINYQLAAASQIDYVRYKLLSPEDIKAIYISEEPSAKFKYAHHALPKQVVEKAFSCVVFIETFPEDERQAKAGKGVRKTWFEGYSEVKEFYQPDYSVLPKEGDYRRTLYWNPALMPDQEGKARIRFYNNGRQHSMRISAETISEDGIVGILNE
ncbi:hypothetical protein [uncultured Alistipes sp.]|uniref:hypothetical protein n=1 Tax=uncultured Alistipes sp. TaxID=538949 RepID=UPI0025CD9E5F|nr:hypothetical protein [uncultured Alistipes sp.]